MTSSFWLWRVACAGVLVSGCAGSGATTTRPPDEPRSATLSSASSTSNASPGALPQTGRAHALVVRATSCWLGGLWSDALGETGDARDARIRRRCDLVDSDDGSSHEGQPTYAMIRAVDAGTVDGIADLVRQTASEDPRDRPRAAELVALLRAVADASRETADARRAADKVKQAFAIVPPADERANKITAAPELRRSRSLHALVALGGPFGEEARGIGTLHAIDRMEIARGLPKHLKVYAVEGAYLDVFGVSAPVLSMDAAAPIPTGTWLAYLTTVATAAGHPVPPDAKNPQNREPLAWNGVLQGFADRLRGARMDPALEAVASGVVARIDRQAAAARATFEAHAPGDR